MRRLLQLWKNLGQNARQSEQDDSDARHYFELAIPMSQLYGIEPHPSLHRYYGK